MTNDTLNSLGLLTGIFALLLAVPLSVTVNLLTPRVKNWWEGSTEARRIRRIKELEQKVINAEKSWLFTPAELEIRYLIIRMHAAVFTGTHVILTFFLFVMAVFQKRLAVLATSGEMMLYMIVGLLFIGIIMNMHSQERKKNEARESWYLHTIEGRLELHKQLNNLIKVQHRLDSAL